MSEEKGERFDKSLIPQGMYCYTAKEIKEDGRMEIELCPYWVRTISGLCVCLYGGWIDVDISDCKAYDTALARYGEEQIEMLTEGGDGLLWDQVKCCGINEGLEDEEDSEGHDCYSCGKCAC